jgi:hypothetical protein
MVERSIKMTILEGGQMKPLMVAILILDMMAIG